MQVSVKIKDSDDVTSKHTAEVNFGNSLEEAIDLFTEPQVYAMYIRGIRVRAQSVLRTLVNGGKSQEEITEHFQEWKPGDTLRTPRDPMAQITENFAKLDDDQRKQLLTLLQNS